MPKTYLKNQGELNKAAIKAMVESNYGPEWVRQRVGEIESVYIWEYVNTRQLPPERWGWKFNHGFAVCANNSEHTSPTIAEFQTKAEAIHFIATECYS